MVATEDAAWNRLCSHSRRQPRHPPIPASAPEISSPRERTSARSAYRRGCGERGATLHRTRALRVSSTRLRSRRRKKPAKSIPRSVYFNGRSHQCSISTISLTSITHRSCKTNLLPRFHPIADIPPPPRRAVRPSFSVPSPVPSQGRTLAICKAALIGPRDRINGNGTEIFGSQPARKSRYTRGRGGPALIKSRSLGGPARVRI